MKAMILAAGLGTRLRPYSLIRPKPLFPILGKPLLSLTIGDLQRAGFGPLVVNAHHLREQIAVLLEQEQGIILQQEEKILGTGGGLRLALAQLGEEPFLAVNGDIYHNIDLAWVVREHRKAGAAVTMVMHDYPRYNTVAVDAGGRVVGFGQEGPAAATAPRLAFTGIQVIEPAVLRLISPGVFASIIDCYRTFLAQGGEIRALVARGHSWTDMGTPADYLALHADLLTGNLGKTAERADSFHLGPRLRLEAGVVFREWVSIGADVRIGSGATLNRVVVWDGAEIPAGAELTDAIVTG